MRFIKTWLEKPLDIGAVSPSSRVLARAMARYVDPAKQGPVIELGPGTGPVTEALVERGIDPSRLVLVEFDPVSAVCSARAIRLQRWCREMLTS
jgi:phosphatidylethanolamine/phosphatidyl-N-methylethanolamine N-methyltransferase